MHAFTHLGLYKSYYTLLNFLTKKFFFWKTWKAFLDIDAYRNECMKYVKSKNDLQNIIFRKTY